MMPIQRTELGPETVAIVENGARAVASESLSCAQAASQPSTRWGRAQNACYAAPGASSSHSPRMESSRTGPPISATISLWPAIAASRLVYLRQNS
jgi:hypothetical protein